MNILDPINHTSLKPSLLELPGNQFLINIYDNDFYSQNDFDIIDGNSRELIVGHYQKEDWVLKGARRLEKNSKILKFAKPSHALGSNPSQNIIYELGTKNTFVFSTPTQSLLVMAEVYRNDDLFWESFDLMSFLENTPANLRCVFQWLKQDGISNFPYRHSELVAANEKIFNSKLD